MPRLSPKSPGDVQVPTFTPLTHSEMSEGQFTLVPGASEESSMLNASSRTRVPSRRALLGNFYSMNPRLNQANEARMRLGSRKKSGTSNRPMIPSVEQSPQGALTSQPV